MSVLKILVTGASGHLGRLVIDGLLEQVGAAGVIALVRSQAAADALMARGVSALIADYDTPSALEAAVAGVERLLLISSNELGRRVAQHANVIAAAKAAGVKRIAYTSVLRADTSPLSVAVDHRQTEAALAASGVPFVVLRNGWYTENYAASIPADLARGAHMGSAGQGRIASAARADYAAAAVAVLTAHETPAGRIYELAGDDSFTLAQYAAELSVQSGKPVAYADTPQPTFKAALMAAGLPEFVAELVSSSDAMAATGALFDDGRQLSALIGRPTTPMAQTIAQALKAL